LRYQTGRRAWLFQQSDREECWLLPLADFKKFRSMPNIWEVDPNRIAAAWPRAGAWGFRQWQDSVRFGLWIAILARNDEFE
jgi:hypothetical protein